MLECSALATGIAAFERLRIAGNLCELVAFNDVLAALCEQAAEMTSKALLPVDKAILCLVVCCCNRRPNVGAAGQDLYQACVRQTLDAADALLNNQSRYKAEVSYNMRAKPPLPLMDKDEAGNLTTVPLRWGSQHRMLARLERDYPGTDPLGLKDIRRPDVIIVRDPSKPPTQNNIARVVEMKFGKDDYGDGQLEEYRAIDPAGKVMELHVGSCYCGNRKKQERDLSLLIAAEAWEKAQPSTMDRVADAAEATVYVLGAIALSVCPFDGPAGEVAAGGAAATSATAALGRVTFSPAGRRAVGQAAAASWVMIFGPANTR